MTVSEIDLMDIEEIKIKNSLRYITKRVIVSNPQIEVDFLKTSVVYVYPGKENSTHKLTKKLKLQKLNRKIVTLIATTCEIISVLSIARI